MLNKDEGVLDASKKIQKKYRDIQKTNLKKEREELIEQKEEINERLEEIQKKLAPDHIADYLAEALQLPSATSEWISEQKNISLEMTGEWDGDFALNKIRFTINNEKIDWRLYYEDPADTILELRFAKSDFYDLESYGSVLYEPSIQKHYLCSRNLDEAGKIDWEGLKQLKKELLVKPLTSKGWDDLIKSSISPEFIVIFRLLADTCLSTKDNEIIESFDLAA